jgi:hypothetical protein
MNEAEQTQFEQHLATVALQPTAACQQAIMYECGRAAGRAELRTRLRAVITTCAVLVTGLAGFNVHLLTSAQPEPVPEFADHGAPVPHPLRLPARETQPEDGDDRFRLRAGFCADVLAINDQQWNVVAVPQSPLRSQERLTTTSWSQLDEPWN